jgi:hypothetical protein
VIETVATLPREDWVKIQNAIADMMAGEFSPEEVAEIRSALKRLRLSWSEAKE